MYAQVKLERGEHQFCPKCREVTEWIGGKIDNTEQEYLCRPCRVYFKVFGMSGEDQEQLAEESFM